MKVCDAVNRHINGPIIKRLNCNILSKIRKMPLQLYSTGLDLSCIGTFPSLFSALPRSNLKTMSNSSWKQLWMGPCTGVAGYKKWSGLSENKVNPNFSPGKVWKWSKKSIKNKIWQSKIDLFLTIQLNLLDFPGFTIKPVTKKKKEKKAKTDFLLFCPGILHNLSKFHQPRTNKPLGRGL